MAAAGIAAAGIGIVGGGAVSKIMNDSTKDEIRPFYDYRNYYKFPNEYTDLIDLFLMADCTACFN